MAKRSNGVSLREVGKVTGQKIWRGEDSAEGGKAALRRRVRRVMAQRLREDLRDGRM